MIGQLASRQGPVGLERDLEIQEVMGARPAQPPAPVPATKQLRTNLERVTLAYNDRERVLVKEIADREAELADVRRARDATTAALIELGMDLPDLTVTDEAPERMREAACHAPAEYDEETGALA